MENNHYPKVLIISHNLYETSNNIGKTLVSLFQDWPKDKLCQIYLRNDLPSFEYCDEYYQILDRDIAKAFFKKGHQVGMEVLPTEEFQSDSKEQNLYQIGNKRYPIVSFLRDIIWNKKRWKNSSLDDWLDKAKPEVILFVPNDYELIYPIAEYIHTRQNIPIIPYYMDDAFYFHGTISFIDLIRRKRLRKKGKRINSLAKELLVIGPKMADEYVNVFKKPCLPVMNSVKIPENLKDEESSFVFSYVGNLHSNRWKSLVKIGKEIDKFFGDTKVSLNIYSASILGKKEIKKLNKVRCITLKGRVGAEQVPEILQNSFALLFVEAFDRKSKLSTRLSLSTKIPEYLSSGTPVLAYGPKDISSMEYLTENNLAYVCSDASSIKTALANLVDRDNRTAMKQRAFEFAAREHNIQIVSKKFQSFIIESWIENQKESHS